MTPELNDKISLWRQRARDGTLTREEMREAISLLRAGRISAAASAKSRTKSPSAPIDAEGLLAGLLPP